MSRVDAYNAKGEMMNQKKWTLAETEWLRNLISKGLRYNQISEIMGRTVGSVAGKAMSLGINPMPQRAAKPNSTICWNCKNAVCSGCAWSRSFKPVDGWEAKRETINAGGRFLETYTVRSCPQFLEG